MKAAKEKKIADLKAENAAIDATVTKCAAGGPCPAKISATGKASAPRKRRAKKVAKRPR